MEEGEEKKCHGRKPKYTVSKLERGIEEAIKMTETMKEFDSKPTAGPRGSGGGA